MSNRRKNSRKENFLKELKSRPSLEDKNDNLTIRCKFNFSYFDSNQPAAQDFKDWKQSQLCSLLNKIKEYSKHPLDYWLQQRIGGGGLKVLAIYGEFPDSSRTAFTRPSYIPHQAEWGRFRFGELRLIGFKIPSELHNTPHKTTGAFFDKNTFYVVFLDKNHKFYIPKKK